MLYISSGENSAENHWHEIAHHQDIYSRLLGAKAIKVLTALPVEKQKGDQFIHAMKLDTIVTMANAHVRLRFLAMERSLRATGCDLPLLVIPYDDNRFELPPNAEWWEVSELSSWVARHQANPMMRKYQCLTLSGYQFVDADVCFLRNPADVLTPHDGFITSCGHWNETHSTVTTESRKLLAASSTIWQKSVFNTGQFACDRRLYTPNELMSKAEHPSFAKTCIHYPHHEQPGINLLVNATNVPVHNLTLPPWSMQSTWAGDYPDEYSSYWHTEQETPYLIHWAGEQTSHNRPIDQIFLSHLSPEERIEWDTLLALKQHSGQSSRWRLFARHLRQALSALKGS